MSDWTVVPKGGGSRGKVPAQQPRQPQPAAQNLEAGAGAGVPFDGAFDPIFSVDILICVDLEATCDEDDGDYKSVIPRDQQEIIEFPFVAIDVASGSILQTVQQYIAPQNTPVTSFCTNLTGITDETLANGTTLAAAVARIDAYAVELAAAGKTFCLVAH
eukprot:gene8167-15495_t